MPLKTVKIPKLTIHVIGPMHIGTGFARGLVDRTVVRRRDGLVYLPGSTLKGRARSACEALARQYDMSDCRAPHPQAMAKDDHRSACVACRIFGAPAKPSNLYWQDASLSQDLADAFQQTGDQKVPFGQTIHRTQVQLDRRRGLAAEAHLFTSELAAEGLTFEAHPALIGRMPLTPMTVSDGEDLYYELVLLLAGLKMVEALGGGKTRGVGRCQVILPDTIMVDRQPVSVDRLLNHTDELILYSDERGCQP